MRPLIFATCSLALFAQTSFACILPPPMAAVFVQDGIKEQTWMIRRIDGLNLPKDTLEMTLGQNGELQVQGLCNDITGQYRGDAFRLELTPTLTSDAFCDADVEALDVELERSLRQVVSYVVDDTSLTLTLSDQRQIVMEAFQ